MAVKDSSTEQQIKEAARRLFFVEGRFKATTQEIADAAGVNRTLVNYYFRSRDVLFDEVLQDARSAMDNRLENSALTDSSIPFKERVEKLLDILIEHSIAYPYMDIYLVTRMNDDICHQNGVLSDMKRTESLKKFLSEVEQQMELGNIEKMPVIQFFLNMVSLFAYPSIAQPLFKKIFNFSNKQYQQILRDRKEIVLRTLLK